VKVFLLLLTVGAVLYGLLLLTDKIVPQVKTEGIIAAEVPPKPAAGRNLRSWGNSLAGLTNQNESRHLDARGEQPRIAETARGGDEDRAITEAEMKKLQTAAVTQTSPESANVDESKPKLSRTKKRDQFSAPSGKFNGKSDWRGRWNNRDGRRLRFGLFGRRFAAFR